MSDNAMYRARRGKTGYTEGKVMYRVKNTGLGLKVDQAVTKRREPNWQAWRAER